MVYKLEAKRQFPARIRIGSRAVGWVESEVQLWLASRLEHHRAIQSCSAHVSKQHAASRDRGAHRLDSK